MTRYFSGWFHGSTGSPHGTSTGSDHGTLTHTHSRPVQFTVPLNFNPLEVNGRNLDRVLLSAQAHFIDRQADRLSCQLADMLADMVTVEPASHPAG